jgi:putative ABC transport system permease protein
MTLLADLTRDLQHGLRLLRRAPGFSAVVLTILAVAIGASVVAFSVVDAWLLRPLNFPDASRLVIGLAAQPDRPEEPAVFLFYRSYLGFKEHSRSFSSVSAAFRRGYLVTGRGNASSALGMAVSEEFFDTLGVSPQLGRALSSRDRGGAPTAVLSHGFWQQQFGGARDVLGTTVMLNGDPHEIVGVMPDSFDVRMLEQPRGAQLWTLITAGERGYDATGMGPVAIYARLRSDVAIGSAQAEMNQLQQRLEAPFPEPQRLSQFPVLLSPLQIDNTRTIRATLITVVAAVGCLLLIACMNVGTLILGRGLGRMQEAAVRAALGSGYARLVRQFLTESVLLAVLGGVAGVALAGGGIRLFTAWDPLGVLPATSIDLNARALAAACAIVGMAVIVSSLVPALRMAAIDPQHALRGSGDRGATGHGHRVQSLLLGGQLAVSLMLLIITSLLAQTFVTLTRAPLGFEPSDLAVADVSLPADGNPEQRLDLYARVAARIAAIPGVQGVAASTSPPLFSGGLVSVRTTSDGNQAPNRFSAQDVAGPFFDTLGMPVVAGRGFDRRDSNASPRVVVLNELAARRLFASPAEAIGRTLFIDEQPPREIVGIVGNTASTFFNTLEWQTNPTIYIPAAQGFAAIANPERRMFGLSVHVRSSRPLALADVRRAAADIDSQVAVTAMETAETSVARVTQQPRFRMTLLLWFSITSLLLTAVGVYGVVAQGVERRAREIGIRVALGARATQVIRMVARRAVTTAAVGAVVGCAAALSLANALKSVIYGVDARDPASMLFAAALLLGVALLAALVPALRATRIDPIRVLRSE